TETGNYIPPYIYQLDGSSSDDNYVYFGDFGLLDSDTSYIPGENYGYDMMVSRWPVRSESEIATIVNKIKSYESYSSFGIWKSTVTLVADDEYIDRASVYEGLDHVRQTETLEIEHLPSKFIRRKVYLWDYPYNSEAFKPDANNAIVNAINDGTILINYVGHGNPDTWAHEHVLNRTTDLQKLTNGDKLAIFYAASCSIGFFDDPKKEGMGEELLRQANGGAAGVFAASRLVTSTANSQFNRKVYDFLFDDSNDLSIGQALFATKLFRQYSGSIPYPDLNDRKYIYFGDPLMRLNLPKRQIEFSDFPALFTALSPHYFAGRIINEEGATDNEFNGNLNILIYDSELNIVHRGLNNDSLAYSKIGPMIYRGTVPITSGQFDFTFIVPLDVGYGGQGAKVFAYAYGSEIDGLGFLDSIEISSEIKNSDDTLGPIIGYYFGESENFVSGDRIPSNSPLTVTLNDTTGLNLTGNAGHRITLTIDNDLENIVNLTDLFEYNPGSYTSGKLSYDIDSLGEGLHNFRIKAWDNVNNASVADFTADVVGSEKLMLTDLLNYPNPMEESTIFSFFLTSEADNVSLDIFTLAGRKIYNYKRSGVPSGFFEFCTWNGRDLDGDRVATGVYIYKVTASALNSGNVVESFGKVAVIN
ncbi:MAG: C25 family cysteine peptidase, partial [Candidatus Zixiibacteriota bacterium]